MMCDTRGQGIDKRKRFGIIFSESTVSMNCFNCGFKSHWDASHEMTGSFKKFLSRIGFTEEAIKRIQFDFLKYHNDNKPPDKIDVSYSTIATWEYVGLPESCLTLETWAENGCEDSDFIRVFEYAESRRLRNCSNLYWSPDRKLNLNNRLIIPFRFKDRVVGYTARFASDSLPPHMPKYLNSMPKSFIYNLDRQLDYSRKTIVLCEGILDAYQMDGISPLGSISNDQADIIDTLNKHVVVVPDRDKSGVTLLDMAIERRWSVSFPSWEKGIKDAAQATIRYGRILTLQNILDTVESNVMFLKLKRKLIYGV